MQYTPLAIKRRNVLGDIYNHCDPIESIPVYMNDKSGELLGHVDESLGHYTDAFLFHLSEEICKKLSKNHYNYGFDYDIFDNKISKTKRIKLNYILLVGKQASSS